MQKVSTWLYASVGRFLDFIDNRKVVRRIIVLVVLWQLCDVYLFAKALAVMAGKTGIEISAIIAALTVPVTALQGLLFKLYGDQK